MQSKLYSETISDKLSQDLGLPEDSDERMGAIRQRLAPGCCHICPKGSEHSVRNTGYIDLVIITVVVGRLEDS